MCWQQDPEMKIGLACLKTRETSSSPAQMCLAQEGLHLAGLSKAIVSEDHFIPSTVDVTGRSLRKNII